MHPDKNTFCLAVQLVHYRYLYLDLIVGQRNNSATIDLASHIGTCLIVGCMHSSITSVVGMTVCGSGTLNIELPTG